MEDLNKLAMALRALSRSVEKALMTGHYEGTSKMMVKNYQSLNARAAELMPDDYYVTDTLALDIEPDSTDKEIVAQVQFASEQLYGYLKGVIKESGSLNPEGENWGSIGRDLQDSIITVTKQALRRAMSSIEVGIGTDEEEDFDPAYEPGKGKRRIRVEIERPPVPPTPPQPPRPPHEFKDDDEII
jgi:hypothetical protein